MAGAAPFASKAEVDLQGHRRPSRTEQQGARRRPSRGGIGGGGFAGRGVAGLLPWVWVSFR
jgi:hypothetical protein